ncbi:MAG: symmetrical bis(5'-nucleosyl)-tetraphosphatase [Colwellia sp.]|nr:symmetrical bis(5'-nucleosyl)-tetraphosphatase [Colwellia sp.]MCW8866636.1 symmetrical bis(5'-nucleosyl)-tetraphosphatase [Colwellia sp.]MCW9082866.1 symmetrical bis(5'-nucleosyl)-tetraphosphatase [Colwellia sp.]
MATYLVGDIQGCYQELKALLAQVAFNEIKDQLYVAGDLVARGPDSLATLRFIKSLNHCAKVVLGNHDLHLLAVYAGIKKVKKQDKLTELLAADDIDELMPWLAKQPLLQQIGNDNAYMSHAGISPQWSLNEAIQQADDAQQKLSSSERDYWLLSMYGEQPNDWQQAKTAEEKFRYTINAFTRMRYCYPNKHLEFENKFSPWALSAESPQLKTELLPWYELSSVINTTTWVFGHWAALMGQCSRPNIYALDTGCVWGNHLTLLRWHDKKTFIEPAHKIAL